MPHFVMEYSQDVEKHHDIKDAMKLAFEAGIASGEFGPKDIKVRAMAYDHYLMEQADESFVHVTVYLLDGRSDATKQAIGKLMLDALSAHFTTVSSVSIDFQDMNRAVYTKRVL